MENFLMFVLHLGIVRVIVSEDAKTDSAQSSSNKCKN